MVEVVVDRGMDGGEFLQGLYVPEPRHCSFSSSERLVRILGSIVEPPLSETPVIVISGHSDKEALDKVRELLGAGSFMLKPLTAAQALTRINAAVKHKFE